MLLPLVESGQYTSVRFTETVALEGLTASIGTVGDAYDNAAAETVMGLFKNEAIAKNSPFRTGPLKGLPDVEEITFDWVSSAPRSASRQRVCRYWPDSTSGSNTGLLEQQ